MNAFLSNLMLGTKDIFVALRSVILFEKLIDSGNKMKYRTNTIKVSKEEKWKIGQVLERAEYNNIDELVRSSLYEMIK